MQNMLCKDCHYQFTFLHKNIILQKGIVDYDKWIHIWWNSYTGLLQVTYLILWNLVHLQRHANDFVSYNVSKIHKYCTIKY